MNLHAYRSTPKPNPIVIDGLEVTEHFDTELFDFHTMLRDAPSLHCSENRDVDYFYHSQMDERELGRILSPLNLSLVLA